MSTETASKPAVARIVEAILVLLETARGMRKPASQFDVISALFIADRQHVKEVGRPITGDAYVAMKGGPVGSVAYDLLKYGILPSGERVPWNAIDQKNRRAVLFCNPERLSASDMFSPRETSALVNAFRTVKSMGFEDTRLRTMSDPAYRSARADCAGNAPAIDLADGTGSPASAVRL